MASRVRPDLSAAAMVGAGGNHASHAGKPPPFVGEEVAHVDPHESHGCQFSACTMRRVWHMQMAGWSDESATNEPQEKVEAETVWLRQQG